MPTVEQRILNSEVVQPHPTHKGNSLDIKAMPAINFEYENVTFVFVIQA